MSRIDYITIAIVAISLGVLIYLLVRIANLNKPIAKQEVTIEQVASTHNLSVDSLAARDTILAPVEDTSSVSLPQKKEPTSTAAVVSDQNFLVVAASFNTKELADRELQRLVKMGYENCEIGYFNRQQIVSVIAGRFNTYEQAEALAKKMQAEHQVEAYVHRKRSQ